MKNRGRGMRGILILVLITIGLIVFFIVQNNYIGITRYSYVNRKIPNGFQDYRIVHISDLHNKDYHGRLSQRVKEIQPDIIVITGDLIDRRNTQRDIAIEFAQEMVKIAPTYYVSGNHEQLSQEYDELKKALKQSNVHIMDQSYTILEKDGDKIGLLGVADPTIQLREDNYLWEDSSGYMKDTLQELQESVHSNFNILLSHRPELFNVYRSSKMDLVFSGHAHGGQIRLPWIGGLVAPNQGFFPKYTHGIYHEGQTSMVVSRGLGNSIFPLRVFNRVELVVVTLHQEPIPE